MQQARILVFTFLMLFCAVHAASVPNHSPNRDNELNTTTDDQEESQKKDTQESKHGSCQQLCVAEGEDPLDCEQFCVEVARTTGKESPLSLGEAPGRVCRAEVPSTPLR